MDDVLQVYFANEKKQKRNPALSGASRVEETFELKLQPAHKGHPRARDSLWILSGDCQTCNGSCTSACTLPASLAAAKEGSDVDDAAGEDSDIEQ